MRKGAKLSQRQLADKLGRERSFVSRIELGERRLDAVELYWVCRACGQNPQTFIRAVYSDFNAKQGKLSKK